MSLSAASFGDWLQGILGQFGVAGQLTLLFVVFAVDALLFPMLPEAFVVLLYPSIPIIDYSRLGPRGDLLMKAAMVLVVVLAAEVAANGLLYGLVKWKQHRLPRALTRAMNKWREFLVLSDERLVLLNRIVPVVPFTGAFIAVSPWRPRRAMGYLVVGGALKYGAVIAVVGVAGLIFDPRQTLWLSLALIAGILALSVASHGYLRRRLRQRLHLPHLHHAKPAKQDPPPSEEPR